MRNSITIAVWGMTLSRGATPRWGSALRGFCAWAVLGDAITYFAGRIASKRRAVLLYCAYRFGLSGPIACIKE